MKTFLYYAAPLVFFLGVVLKILAQRHRARGKSRSTGLFGWRCWLNPDVLSEYYKHAGWPLTQWGRVLLGAGLTLMALFFMFYAPDAIEHDLRDQRTSVDTIHVHYFGPFDDKVPMHESDQLTLRALVDSIVRERDEARVYGNILRGFLNAKDTATGDSLPVPLWHTNMLPIE
jgi:hypothetical protein